jgi:hypothetical protein
MRKGWRSRVAPPPPRAARGFVSARCGSAAAAEARGASLVRRAPLARPLRPSFPHKHPPIPPPSQTPQLPGQRDPHAGHAAAVDRPPKHRVRALRGAAPCPRGRACAPHRRRPSARRPSLSVPDAPPAGTYARARYPLLAPAARPPDHPSLVTPPQKPNTPRFTPPPQAPGGGAVQGDDVEEHGRAMTFLNTRWEGNILMCESP